MFPTLEAHPLDPGALHCCSDNSEERDFHWHNNIGVKGEKLKTHMWKEHDQVEENINKEAIRVMMDQGIDDLYS